MDGPSSTPQWAVLPQDAQDTSDDSAGEDELASSPRARPGLAPTPSFKRNREIVSTETTGRSRKRLKQATEHEARDFARTGPSTSSLGLARVGQGSSQTMKPTLTHSVAGKVPHAPSETRRLGNPLRMSSVPKKINQNALPDDSSSSPVDDRASHQVAKKTTRAKLPFNRVPSKQASPSTSVIEISSDSDSSPARQTQCATKRTGQQVRHRRKVQVPIPNSPKKSARVGLEIKSAPIAPTASWKMFSESFNKAYGPAKPAKGSTSSSTQPKPGAGSSKQIVQDSNGKQKLPGSTLDGFVLRREKGSAPKPESPVDRRPLTVALGIDSPISGSRSPTPTSGGLVNHSDGPLSVSKKLGKLPAVASSADLATMIQQAGAKNSWVSAKQRKTQNHISRLSSSAESAGVSKDTAIDLTFADSDDNISSPMPPALRRKRPKPKSSISNKPHSMSALKGPSQGTSFPAQMQDETASRNVREPVATKSDIVMNITTAEIARQVPSRLPSPAIRRHTMPMQGTATSAVDDTSAPPITRIAIPAAPSSKPSSAPPISPISSGSSHSLEGHSPLRLSPTPEVPAKQPSSASIQGAFFVSKDAPSPSATSFSRGSESVVDEAFYEAQDAFSGDETGMDVQSDTSEAMEVDAILEAHPRDPSSDLDDITEALGTQTLKTSSPLDEDAVIPDVYQDESMPVEVYNVEQTTSPPDEDVVLKDAPKDLPISEEVQNMEQPPSFPKEVAPPPRSPSAAPAEDALEDFYASDEGIVGVTMPHAPPGPRSRSTSTSDSSIPCRTPDDDVGLPIAPLIAPAQEGKISFGGISALTFDTWRDTYQVEVKYTGDLPTRLHNFINSYSPEFRMSKDMREVLQAAILCNTMEDEPLAPPIDIINEVDDEVTPPWEFYYTNQLYHAPGVPPPDTVNLKGCDCVGRCDPRNKACLCAVKQGVYMDGGFDDLGNGIGFVYDKNRRLKTRGIPIFECNDICGCDADCGNRVVQHGRTVQLSIQKTEQKGWGVFAGPKKIPAGTFLGIYSGELLTNKESHQRGLVYDASDRTYLFDLDFYYLSTGDDWDAAYTVDAYHAGNFTRFLNHSCEPNCRMYGCYINEGNMEKPLLVVFTTRDIDPFQEICFNYMGKGYPEDDDPDAPPETEDMQEDLRNDAVYKPCQCGAKSCSGKMF